jgi:hypothetical protein
MTKPIIQIELVREDHIDLLLIRLPYDPLLIKQIKKLKDVQWNSAKKYWYVPYSDPILEQLRDLFDPYAGINELGLNEAIR